MFEIKENGIYPLIKIATPNGCDFLDEHLQIIKKYGYVWFCRFGKNNMKIQKLQDANHIMFIKDIEGNGGKVYIAEFDKIEQCPAVSNDLIPHYYKDITKYKGVWFRITKIEEFSRKKLEEYFVVNVSNGSVSGVLRSMCPAAFLRCEKNIY